jgi:hypothetical protein
MPTPDEQPKSRSGYVIAAVSGAVGGACGGLLIAISTGLLGPGWDVLEVVLCFGLVGLLAGFTVAVLCVDWVTKHDTRGGFGVMMFSLLIGWTAGLIATLPLALLIKELIHWLGGIGHS